MTDLEYNIIRKKLIRKYEYLTGKEICFDPYYGENYMLFAIISPMGIYPQPDPWFITIMLKYPLKRNQTVASYLRENFIPQPIEYL